MLNVLTDETFFFTLYKAGFISVKFFQYRDIYLWVQAQIHQRGLTKNQAVLEAEVHFNRDERTIWRAISCFETLID